MIDSIEGMSTSQKCILKIAVELQWLEHRWLVNNDCFELIIESLGIIPSLQIQDNLGRHFYLTWAIGLGWAIAIGQCPSSVVRR